VQVLIGYYGHEGATRPYLDLRLRLDGVSRVLRGDAARVRIIHLPDSGPAPLPRPPVLSDGMESIADDSMVFDLGRLSVHDAIAITLGEP
jgi:hypothetical protein